MRFTCSESFRKFLFLGLIPAIFLGLRLALVPVVWPEKAAAECLDPPYDGCGFIFDEAHYVPVVRKMITGRFDVNLEHPPLSKWIIMAGVMIFGDNPWGWRTLNLLFSAATILVVGILAYMLSGSYWLAAVSELFMASDVTFFNLSGTAILDPPALFFMALAIFFYVRGLRLPAAVCLGLSLLAKASGLIALIALAGIDVGYPLVNTMRIDKAFEAFRKYLRDMFFPALLVFLLGMGIWDAQVGVFPTPLHHLSYMLDYHSHLTYNNPLEVELPLSWIIPPISRGPAPFLVAEAGPGLRQIAFWGVSSPLWWSSWLLLPLAYFTVRDRRPVSNPNPELILLAWFVITYGSFAYLAYVAHRWVYLFYFLQVLVILAPLAPIILKSHGYELILKILLAFQLLWFIMWFPVKPRWLLELMASLGLGDVPWAI